ncbi:MAG TPA: cyclic peptide export ABC transporter [Thermoanaerobaculia bacterium]|nr:cyclic peptide export ABC transporter [Thermoanaerobaculia bacterium]
MGDLFKLLSFLRRLAKVVPHSAAIILGITVAGIVGGLANTALLALINATIARGPETPGLLAKFAAFCLVLPLFRLASQLGLIYLSQRSSLALRLDLSRRILAAPLRQLEAVGPHRLTTVITLDIFQLIEVGMILPVLSMQATVILSSMVYLGWLSWRVLLYVLGFLILGLVGYRLPLRVARTFVERARGHSDVVLKHLRSLAEGTKELKMHGARRDAYMGDVEAAARAVQNASRTGYFFFAAGSAWGQTLFFVLIGFLLFFLPKAQAMPTATLFGFIMVLFQVSAPLDGVLNAMPTVSRALASARAIERLGISLEAGSGPREVDTSSGAIPHGDWGALEVAGVEHTYRAEGAGGEAESFTLGPIDLAFRPGELVFLIGGNGSGKTTLAKILLGLYPPEKGEIRLGGQPVTDETRAVYREHFAAVFSDFFLFERLLGDRAADLELDESARRYLERLRLSHKVKVEGGVLSSLELSQGQRKRLALLTAFLEDRPIYLFDEWAADQDPFFKEVFYRELLPEFKARGKTVFVISHDDHYYGVADRLIKLDTGKVEFDVRSMDAPSIAASFARTEGGRK